jgi:hypothetical protein
MATLITLLRGLDCPMPFFVGLADCGSTFGREGKLAATNARYITCASFKEQFSFQLPRAICLPFVFIMAAE